MLFDGHDDGHRPRGSRPSHTLVSRARAQTEAPAPHRLSPREAFSTSSEAVARASRRAEQTDSLISSAPHAPVVASVRSRTRTSRANQEPAAPAGAVRRKRAVDEHRAEREEAVTTAQEHEADPRGGFDGRLANATESEGDALREVCGRQRPLADGPAREDRASRGGGGRTRARGELHQRCRAPSGRERAVADPPQGQAHEEGSHVGER